MSRPKLLVFASGTPTGGGSGFENLVRASRDGELQADIVGVVSNHSTGGVAQRAHKLDIPFIYFPAPWDAKRYQAIAADSGAQYFALSGWIKKVEGLSLATPFNSRTVFNIHPGPLPQFGGQGMYGHHVHEAVMEAFGRGEITNTEICMHFVDERYDHGPVFFRRVIMIKPDDNPFKLGISVIECEHFWQPRVTNLVVHEEITWDGVNPSSLKTPTGHILSDI